MGEPLNSMCAVYAHLIRNQLDSESPDMETVGELLTYIEEHCSVSPYQKGETPEHLEEHLFEDGDDSEGTVVVDGKEIPASAASRLE